MLNQEKIELELDEDIEASAIDDTLDLNEMKRHILACLASLIRFHNKMEQKKKKDEIEDEIELETAEDKVFVGAVSMASQELIDFKEEKEVILKNLLEAFPNKPKDGWLPLTWAIVAGD